MALSGERPSVRDTLVVGRQLLFKVSQLFFKVSPRGCQLFLHVFSDRLQLCGYGRDVDGRSGEAGRPIAPAFATRTARRRAGGKLAFGAGARARIAVAGNAFGTSARTRITTAGRALGPGAPARTTTARGALGAG